jgi:pyruvate dehydrogenase E2 component (dihydrolipoamide acetyltransferase)
MIEFEMPSLGADMDAGTLVEWFKRPGDPVKRGDIIALVETQKGAIEIEVFHDGTLGEVKVNPGHKVPVGTVLATIVQAGEAFTPKPVAAERPPERQAPRLAEPPPPAAPPMQRRRRRPAV